MLRSVMAGVLICGVAVLGCSSSSSNPSDGVPSKEDHLMEVGGLISSYSGEFKKGPAKAADLARYEQGYPLGLAAIKSGDIVVIWGAKMEMNEGGGPSTLPPNVIAYGKDVPTAGGSVLLQNGTVKQMTADEFKTAEKAK